MCRTFYSSRFSSLKEKKKDKYEENDIPFVVVDLHRNVNLKTMMNVEINESKIGKREEWEKNGTRREREKEETLMRERRKRNDRVVVGWCCPLLLYRLNRIQTPASTSERFPLGRTRVSLISSDVTTPYSVPSATSLVRACTLRGNASRDASISFSLSRVRYARLHGVRDCCPS